jgi:hypothetical protein
MEMTETTGTCRRKEGMKEEQEPAPSIPPPRYTLSILAKYGCSSVNAEGRMGNKSCLAIIDSRTSLTIAHPDITARLTERDVNTPYIF